MTIWLYESYDGMMDWWPSPNSWTSVDNPADYRTCVQTVHTVHLGHLGLVVKKHSFCFFPKNICSIINGLIINGVIINGLITNGLITNGLIIFVDHLWSYVPVSWMLSTRLAHMITNGTRAIYSTQMDKRQFSLLVWCNHPEKRKQSWHTQI